ncbi:MAG: glycosyltransferase family 4 protein [Methanoregula sp.]|nr:glycosyltransferase family 4 protein [Methanoregula sp.]
MKIAFIYDVIYPYVKGGVEKRVWELATRLAARGHEVHIFGMKYWQGDDILEKEGVILHGVYPSYPLYADGRRKIAEVLGFSICLFPALSRERFDIIDCQQFPYFSCIVASAVAWMRRTPIVITWHEVWGRYWYEYLGWTGCFGKAVERITALLTENTLAVSATTARNVKTLRIGRAPAILANGIDLKRLAAIPPSTDTTDLIFAGRLIKEKHADVLIEAMRILVRDKPDIRLLIIGEGPEEELIRDLIEKYSLDGNIRVMGFLDTHDTVLSRMKSSKVFVLPSTREGFGIVALEALACGLPVVTVDNPANAARDQITEKTGFLSPLSPDGLAANIRKALASGTTMKPACIDAAGAYDWDAISLRAEEYYQMVIRDSKKKIIFPHC